MLRRQRRFRRVAATVEELNQAIIEKERQQDVYSGRAIALAVNVANKLAGPGSDFRTVADDEDTVWDFVDLDQLEATKDDLAEAVLTVDAAYQYMEMAVNARRAMFELEDELDELKKIRRPEAEDYLKLTEGVVRRRTRRQDG